MVSRRQPPVIVVGAGVGGLACAIDLAARGVQVTVLERAAQPGGKMRAQAIGGQLLDAGPTVFTMRWVFDELFAAAGASLDAQVSLTPLQTLARHAWAPDQRMDLHRDLERSVDQIARLAGPAAGRGYRDFCVRAQRIHDTLERPFLRAARPNPVSLLTRAGVRGLPSMLRIAPFATLWSALGSHFQDPRLRQLFGRYATYCGSSPFQAPATLMLVAHVERQGVWTLGEGMHGLAGVLMRLAQSLGVRLHCGTQVSEILLGAAGANGVRLADGERLDASAVVFNGDSAALGQGLLGVDVARRLQPAAAAQRSLSAITWNLIVPTEGMALARHNVFFSADSEREFRELVVDKRLPTDPTVYVCAQDSIEPGVDGVAPAQRLLCLVNAPAQTGANPLSEQELQRCEQNLLLRLRRCGLKLQLEPGATPTLRTTPADFERLFPGSGGALYGTASHGWKASFRRPGSRTKIRQLYLAGGTTHPGPGVPMAALSGRLAAASLLQDWAMGPVSMPGWRPAATAGGISMR